VGKSLKVITPPPHIKMPKRSREDPDVPAVDEAQDKLTASSPSSTLPSESDSTSHEKSKIVHLDVNAEGGVATQMLCSLPGHRQTLSFSSFEDYEVHYNKAHVNRCSECSKNFPTAHFLNLHISENHDPLVAVLKERGEKTVSIIALIVLMRMKNLTNSNPLVWLLCGGLRSKMLDSTKETNAPD
jgi:hypothetical protein